MTKKEAIQILAILKAAYPNSYNNMTAEEATGTVAVWTMQFSELPADIVMMALHKLIATNRFPPSIAEIKDKIGALRWEAYEAIYTNSREQLPAPLLEQYKRVYAVTEKYGKMKFVEPSLSEMIGGNNFLMLKGE